jgi:hypothetical protein
MDNKYFFNNHPLLLVITNLRGQILEASPWAERFLNLEVGTPMQEYFYEADATKVVTILQSCDPIVREPLRIEVHEGAVMHVQCTVLTNEDRLMWSFEDIHELVQTQEQLKSLKMLPQEYGHEINNCLTVIGSAAEGIKMDALEELMIEDADAILSMTDRAAILTRRFIHLGRKSLLPSEIVSVENVLNTEKARLERLLDGVLHTVIQAHDAHVFASSFMLRNIWMSSVLYFEGKSCTMEVSISTVTYHFASKVLGLPSGTYVVMSLYEEGYEYAQKDVLSTRGLVVREADCLQGAWESLTRCRGGLCQHHDASGKVCMSLFMPLVHPITAGK